MEHVFGYCPETISAAMRYIAQFDHFIKHSAYSKVTTEHIIAFKALYEAKLRASGKDARAASTIVHCFSALKKFFTWLETQRNITLAEANLGAYFGSSNATMALTRVTAEKQSPSVNDIEHLLTNMPKATFIDLRNRAMIALVLITGIRLSACISLKLKHVNLEDCTIFQDANEVQTKASKSMLTVWFPISDFAEEIFIAYVTEYRHLGATSESPLFPRAFDKIRGGDNPIDAFFITDKSLLGRIIDQACDSANIIRFTPHVLRTTVARYASEADLTEAQMSYWSVGLGHQDIATTRSFYSKPNQATYVAGMMKHRQQIKNQIKPAMLERLSLLTESQRSSIEMIMDNYLGKNSGA